MALFELTQEESDELKQEVLSFIHRVLNHTDMSVQEEAAILPTLAVLLREHVSIKRSDTAEADKWLITCSGPPSPLAKALVANGIGKYYPPPST